MLTALVLWGDLLIRTLDFVRREASRAGLGGTAPVGTVAASPARPGRGGRLLGSVLSPDRACPTERSGSAECGTLRCDAYPAGEAPAGAPDADGTEPWPRRLDAKASTRNLDASTCNLDALTLRGVTTSAIAYMYRSHLDASTPRRLDASTVDALTP